MGSSDLRLPTPPQVLAKVIEAASDPETSMVALGKLTAQDPAFAAEILRLSNSAMYSGGGPVHSVMRAVAVLGARGLRNMALCSAARNCVDEKQLGDFDLRRYWEDSLRRAVANQILAEKLKIVEPNEAFTAGLLQDLGVLALIMTNPEHSAGWMDMVDQDPELRRAEEKATFGMSHDEVGEVLAKNWKLPEDLAKPLSDHHTPKAESTEATKIARWAELLVAVLACTDKRSSLDNARKILQEEANLSGEEVDQLVADLGARVEEAAQLFGMNVETQPSMQAIVMAANRSLAEMNLNYEELVTTLEDTLGKLETALAEKRQLEAQLRRQNQELNRLSLTDPLTGMPNRRAFSVRMAENVRQIARSGGQLVFMIGDIDHFKIFNDTHGHDFGDEVLKMVGITMSATMRQTDMVARLGGEEFGVLLPDTDRAGGLIAAKKILRAVRSKEMQTPEHGKTNVTLSLGLAVLKGPHHGAFDEDSLLNRIYKAADASLYASKHAGRDRATDHPNDISWDLVEDKAA